MSATIRAKLTLDTKGIGGGMSGSKGGGGAGGGLAGMFGKMLNPVTAILGILVMLKPIMGLIKMVLTLLMVMIYPFMKPLMLLTVAFFKAVSMFILSMNKFVIWLGQSFLVPLLKGIDKIVNSLTFSNSSNLGGHAETAFKMLEGFNENIIKPMDEYFGQITKIMYNQVMAQMTGAESENEMTRLKKQSSDTLVTAQTEQTTAIMDSTQAMQGMTLTGTKASEVWSRVMNSLFDPTTGWAQGQLAGQAMPAIAGVTGQAGYRGMSAGYDYGHATSDVVARAGISKLTGSTGQAGTGNSYGGKYHDATLLVTPRGVKEFDSGDTIVARKGGNGMGGGNNVTVNVSANNNIRDIMQQIEKKLKTSLGGNNNYDPS